MKKRVLSAAMALAMLLTLLPTSAFAARAASFSDVETGDWFYDEVLYVKDKGLMTGTSDATFTPGGNTTRGMIVTILHRLSGQPAAADSPFLDVDHSQDYADAVDWAVANGVVTGYSAAAFGPNDPITREQLAAIFYRYASLMGYDLSAGADANLLGFADTQAVSEYAVDALQWAVGAGLINGVDGNRLAPQGLATRAQVAAILYRFCTQVVEETPVTYTVTLKLNDGTSGIYKTFPVEEGKTLTAPKNPARSGYTFAGWFTAANGGEKFDFSQAITDDVTLYAQWNKVVTHRHSYTIVNNENGTHSKVCRCGRIIIETCTEGENGVCTVCGDDATKYVAAINGVKCDSLQEALDAANGGTVTLLDDIVLNDPLIVSSSVTLDLNGKTITGGETVYPVIRVQNGATATVKNGTITNEDYVFVLGASDGSSSGNLIIESGTYHGVTSVASVTKGTLTINGGTFSVDPYNGNYNFLLNCIDVNYQDDSANIVVQGGTFENFNPADNASEGSGTNLVGDGYTAIQNGNNWVVVKGSSSSGYEVSSADALKAGASQTNTNVTMTENLAAQEKITLNGGSLNGGGKTLTFDTVSDTATTINVGISAKNGADISNLTIVDNTDVKTSNGETKSLRAIYLEGSGDFTVSDVYIVSNGYALNTGSIGSGSSLAVSNSTLAGWTSFAGVSPATFTNCIFADAGQQYKYVRTYVNVTFENCSFDEGYTMDFADGYSGKIILNNCTVNGIPLTTENAKTLLNMDDDTFAKVVFSNP